MHGPVRAGRAASRRGAARLRSACVPPVARALLRRPAGRHVGLPLPSDHDYAGIPGLARDRVSNLLIQSQYRACDLLTLIRSAQREMCSSLSSQSQQTCARPHIDAHWDNTLTHASCVCVCGGGVCARVCVCVVLWEIQGLCCEIPTTAKVPAMWVLKRLTKKTDIQPFCCCETLIFI